MDNNAPDIAGVIGGLAVVIFAFVVVYLPVWKIIRKAGYNGWWVLIWLVPLVNIIMLWVFAFSDWPNLVRRPPPPPIA
jgi:hypothetical protein